MLQKSSTLIGQLATVHNCDWLTKDKQIYKLSSISPWVFRNGKVDGKPNMHKWFVTLSLSFSTYTLKSHSWIIGVVYHKITLSILKNSKPYSDYGALKLKYSKEILYCFIYEIFLVEKNDSDT